MVADARARHVELSWRLIELKTMYYMPHLVHASWHDDLTVPDAVYDEMERRYLALCRELGVENTVVHKSYPGFDDVPGDGMMEIDRERPSVQLVLRKLGQKRRAPSWEL